MEGSWKQVESERGDMIQKELFDERERLFERLCETATLRQGYASVKANGGSPGTDGVSVKQYEQKLEEELAHLKAELEGWSYKPRPVRRVEIPKPGGKGVRLLGVPCIRDRVVQASLKLPLEPLFDPYFSASSYGFRPGKNQRQAVEAAQRIVQSGKEHAVSDKATKAMRRTMGSWTLQRRSDKSLDDLSRMFNPILRGWITYYGQYYKSALYPALVNLNRILARWAMRKYKRLQRHSRRAVHWLGRIARQKPKMFGHWEMGLLPTVGR